MCKEVLENPIDLVQTSLARQSADVNVVKNFLPLEGICEDINRILAPTQDQPTEEMASMNSDSKPVIISSPIPQGDRKADSSANNKSKEHNTEMEEGMNDAKMDVKTEIVLDD